MMKTQDLPHQQACAAWSNRVLLISLLGISYLTLFPFRLHYLSRRQFDYSPFLLGPSVKHAGGLDFFLNILLFIPFGFGLAAEARKRGMPRWAGFLIALAIGALTSYSVEFLQLFIPQRDSGWDDVRSNTTGSVAGFLLFEICGGLVLGLLHKSEIRFVAWLTPRRIGWLLLLYFTAWFGISARLQRETRLSNWDSQCILLAGNDASGRAPWHGQILLLQFWNRTLSEQSIRQISNRETPADAEEGLLASYDFTGPQFLEDRKNFLPPFRWTPRPPPAGYLEPPAPDGGSWLSTGVPAGNLTREIQRTSHFTIHVICTPAMLVGATGRIVSLSQSFENVNFHLRQQGADLFFFFRNPLSEKNSILVFFVPSVFLAGETRDIIAEYDGSDAFVYVNGKPAQRKYHLSPGASLAHKLISIQTGDLDGYAIVYETLVFLPAGFLVGFGVESLSRWKASLPWLIGLGLVAPAILLEFFMIAESGRRLWPENIALSVFFGLAGILLMNADGRSKPSRAAA